MGCSHWGKPPNVGSQKRFSLGGLLQSIEPADPGRIQLARLRVCGCGMFRRVNCYGLANIPPGFDGVAISPNGQVAVSAGNDSTARLWSTDTRACSTGRVARARARSLLPDSIPIATWWHHSRIRCHDSILGSTNGALIGEPMMHQAW